MANRTSVVTWGVSAVLVALVIWLRVGALPAAPHGAVRPDVNTLERLAEYLRPVDDNVPVRGERGWLGPVQDPFVLRRAAPEPGRVAMSASRRLSAILISPARRVAIIDDRLVEPGARLSGGTRVAEIERDRVVLREPDGTRQVLRINEGGDR